MLPLFDLSRASVVQAAMPEMQVVLTLLLPRS
jgi:hypothetical protein